MSISDYEQPDTEASFEKELTVTFPVKGKIAAKHKGYIGLCGWHGNYGDFELEGVKCMMTFIQGTITITIDGVESHSFEVGDVIGEYIQERIRGLRRKDKKNESA